MATALGRHLALVGFMGAGKTTVGEQVARRLDRGFIDLDREIEARTGSTIVDLFTERGESGFRSVEERIAADVLDRGEPAVVALGGGAVLAEATQRTLRNRAFTVLLDVDVQTAWGRVRDAGRPLAQDEGAFVALFDRRAPVYERVADSTARDVDDVVLAAGGLHVERGALERLGDFVAGDGGVALVSDAHVAGIYGADAQLALGARLASAHELPPGEAGKTLASAQSLWSELTIDRGGTVVALGGGCVTDAAGFVAATHLRGVPWVAVPTTLVGQVDAAIGGKTGLDTPGGKNLVGAFHWPVRTVVDHALLATLPDAERRAGLAEVVKTGLLAGQPLWELPEAEAVRRCAAFKTAVCLRDPTETGERAILNLGHTFAHALEAASGYRLRHGDAVALGLRAALRLSEENLGLDGSWAAKVEDVLHPQPVAVDREKARAALARDKKGGRLVLLESPGRPVVTHAIPRDAVYAALDALITG